MKLNTFWHCDESQMEIELISPTLENFNAKDFQASIVIANQKIMSPTYFQNAFLLFYLKDLQVAAFWERKNRNVTYF